MSKNLLYQLSKIPAACSIWLLVFCFSSCNKEETPPESSEQSETTSLAEKLTTPPEGFPPIPFPSDNPFSIEKWELGKRIFFEKALSIDSSISCASCHKQSLAFADDLAFSPGAFQRDGIRNAPSLGNIAYHPYFLREGGVPTLEMQALVPIQEQNEFAHDIISIAKLLAADSSYVQASLKAFNRLPDPYVLTRALGTYQRTLVSGNSLFDQFKRRKAAFSKDQLKGMELFFGNKANCSKCHGDFNFTNYAFENNGLYTEYTDPGRFRLTGDTSDIAKFKVPSLRNVEVTAPYMHDGSIASLKEVIDHYSSGGKNHRNKSNIIQPLNLNEEEKLQLVSFLKTLTDDEFITNPNFR